MEVRHCSAGLVINLESGCNIAAGDTVKIGLTVVDPTSNFSFSVASTVNGTAVASNTVTINAIPPTVAASQVTVGGGAVYTISGLGTTPTGQPNGNPVVFDEPYGRWDEYSISQPGDDLGVCPVAPVGPTANNSIVWYASSNGSGYSVTYTPSGGSLTTDTVTSAVISSSAWWHR